MSAMMRRTAFQKEQEQGPYKLKR